MEPLRPGADSVAADGVRVLRAAELKPGRSTRAANLLDRYGPSFQVVDLLLEGVAMDVYGVVTGIFGPDGEATIRLNGREIASYKPAEPTKPLHGSVTDSSAP